jgi:iron(III) transport system ATP-binding protein
LDEPSSNLDAQLRNEMHTEIHHICKDYRLTSIYMTHDQKEELSLADHIPVLDQGNICQIGSPLDLYKPPDNCFAANFIGETNIIDGVVIRKGIDEVFVTTKIGNFRGMIDTRNNKIRQGHSGKVLIRPESIKLESVLAEKNCVEGIVDRSRYFGDVVHQGCEKNGMQLRISEFVAWPDSTCRSPV